LRVSTVSVINSEEPETHCHIHDVDSDTTHILLGAHTFLRRPLECSDTGVLDFVEILHTLGNINHQVRTGGIGAETPDLASIGHVPAVLVSENTSASLEIVARVDLAVLDRLAELIFQWQSLRIQTIVLVLRLGESDNGRFCLDSLAVPDDGIGLLKRDASVVFLEILYPELR
jgi:hypothetical protein